MVRIVLLALLCLAAWKAYETYRPRQVPSQAAAAPYELPVSVEFHAILTRRGCGRKLGRVMW